MKIVAYYRVKWNEPSTCQSVEVDFNDWIHERKNVTRKLRRLFTVWIFNASWNERL